jgi:curved DNA-binding protein CbpA
MATLYDELGVTKDATAEQIKAAHRKAVKAHHPDAGGDKQKFQQIQLAYDTLKDKDRRERYDRTGDTGGAQRPDEVLEAVAQIFHGLIEEMVADGCRIETQDMKERARAAIDANRQATANQRVIKERQLKKAAALSKRWKRKRKAKDFDMIGDTLLRKQRDLSEEIAKIKQAEEIWKRAGKILEDYDYKVDKPKPSEPSASGGMKMSYHEGGFIRFDFTP